MWLRFIIFIFIFLFSGDIQLFFSCCCCVFVLFFSYSFFACLCFGSTNKEPYVSSQSSLICSSHILSLPFLCECTLTLRLWTGTVWVSCLWLVLVCTNMSPWEFGFTIVLQFIHFCLLWWVVSIRYYSTVLGGLFYMDASVDCIVKGVGGGIMGEFDNLLCGSVNQLLCNGEF